MKKNYWSMLTILVVAMLGVCFVSCKGDDGDIPSEKDKFVGGWDSSYGNGNVVFTYDGICFSPGEVDYGHYGEWDYNTDTKQLATTMEGESWVVSMITDNAWTGTSSKRGSSITYKRNDLHYLIGFFDMMKGWSTDYSNIMASSLRILDTTDPIQKQMKEYSDLDDYPESKYYTLSISNEQGEWKSDVKITKNTITTTEKVSLWFGGTRGQKKIFTGTITINNYGKQNAEMVLDGIIPSSGEKCKTAYGASCYFKDKKLVYVDE